MVKSKKPLKPVKHKLLFALFIGFVVVGAATTLWQYLTVGKSQKIELQGRDGTEINRFLQEHLLAVRAKGTSSPPVPAFTSLTPTEITRETTEVKRSSTARLSGGTLYANAYCYTYVGRINLADGSSQLMLASVYDVENAGRVITDVVLDLEAEEEKQSYSCKDQ